MNAKIVLLPEAQDLEADNYGFGFKKGNVELATRSTRPSSSSRRKASSTTSPRSTLAAARPTRSNPQHGRAEMCGHVLFPIRRFFRPLPRFAIEFLTDFIFHIGG